LYIILLGAPGAGKGTQAAIVAQKLNLVHIASGDLFRQALERGTSLWDCRLNLIWKKECWFLTR